MKKPEKHTAVLISSNSTLSGPLRTLLHAMDWEVFYLSGNIELPADMQTNQPEAVIVAVEDDRD
ncbi:MAG: hypothetical protein GY697_26410, partial [Desulfobacterales bacterium]|nr:hypothetical protein [Desulfobacterales bacterium]